MRFNFEATGIGSVPFKDPEESCRVIIDNFSRIPFWPQLPKRSFLENMYVQFSENIPGLVVDETAKTIRIETSKVAGDIERLYGKYVDGDVEFFRISEDHAAGFYKFLEAVRPGQNDARFVKGHITGPISYALFLTDQNKRPIIYDRDLFEVVTKVLAMKARWQIRRLKKVFPAVIVFIDEPYLVSIGSSFVNINIESAFEKLDEVVSAVKSEGAIAGLHCCGNTDWGKLLERGIDILNFDAYNFAKELSLYGADLKSFLARGGTLAWGMVPSSDSIKESSVKSLLEKMRSAMSLLAGRGIDKEGISSLITPSCGLGSLDEDTARKVMEAARKVSEELRG